MASTVHAVTNRVPGAATTLERERALAREDLCRFLSACFYEPTPMFAEERLFESMLRASRQIDPELAERVRALGEAYAAEDSQALLVDHTRLFLGPIQPRAQPYGSVWLGGEPTLMQDSTMAVIELYREGGFEIDDEFRDLPDHVSVELEFLYVLNFRENQAVRAGDAAAVEAVAALRRRFLAEHLGAWIGRFADALRQGAETAFYRELAGVVQLWVRRSAEVDTPQ